MCKQRGHGSQEGTQPKLGGQAEGNGYLVNKLRIYHGHIVLHACVCMHTMHVHSFLGLLRTRGMCADHVISRVSQKGNQRADDAAIAAVRYRPASHRFGSPWCGAQRPESLRDIQYTI